MRVILKDFRVIDEETDTRGTVIIDDGFITGFSPFAEEPPSRGANINTDTDTGAAAMPAVIIDGSCLVPSGRLPVLMPAFVDLHAHFRDPGFPEKENVLPSELSLPSEVLESACLSAAAGGFGTVVCMANTKPAADSLKKIVNLKKRADALGLIDLYPVMSLTKGMEGKELSEIRAIPPPARGAGLPLMLSEDGKDVACDALFLDAMKEAARLGVPVSCHCDFGGDEARAAKDEGRGRGVWSRIEENNATRRVIELGEEAGCHIHIAHVSTQEAVEMIRAAKERAAAHDAEAGAFTLTCEAVPHNLCLTEDDARRLGDESFGRVNPPLRPEEDRQALIRAVVDGTIDAIATDHAPHTNADKEKGAPGFSGLETAFAAVFTGLARDGASFAWGGASPTGEPRSCAAGADGSAGGKASLRGEPANSVGGQTAAIDLKRLSSLMSARPAWLLGLSGAAPAGEPRSCAAGKGSAHGELCPLGGKVSPHIGARGRVLPGYRADLVIIDTEASWKVDPAAFKSRGKNSPFAGRELYGKILMTLHEGRVVYTYAPV